jgi:hypothetical protein
MVALVNGQPPTNTAEGPQRSMHRGRQPTVLFYAVNSLANSVRNPQRYHLVEYRVGRPAGFNNKRFFWILIAIFHFTFSLRLVEHQHVGCGYKRFLLS